MNSPIEISSDSEVETITSGSGDDHSILYVADFEISDIVLSLSIAANKPAFLPRKQLVFLRDQQEFIYLGRKHLPELIVCTRNRSEASSFLTAHDGTWNFPVKCPQCALWLQDVNLVIDADAGDDDALLVVVRPGPARRVDADDDAAHVRSGRDAVLVKQRQRPQRALDVLKQLAEEFLPADPRSLLRGQHLSAERGGEVVEVVVGRALGHDRSRAPEQRADERQRLRGGRGHAPGGLAEAQAEHEVVPRRVQYVALAGISPGRGLVTPGVVMLRTPELRGDFG